jgi:hypothetical protein
MTNPTPGEVVRAKETSPTAYDDTMGVFRQNLVRKVEGALQFHRDNAADASKTYYRMGFYDPVNMAIGPSAGFGGVQQINGTSFFFTKGGNKIALADLLGPPPPILTNDGQVPQNAGDRIDGQTSFWDINGGQGIVDGSENATDVASLANAIIEHTKVLTRVRMADITERMATTSKNWNSKTYPATFSENGKTYTGQFKGDTIAQYEDLYTFSNTGSKSGMTFFVAPFQSAKNIDIFYQTVINDAIRGPRTDQTEEGEGGGPDPYGEYIYAQNIIDVFNRMDKIWEASKTKKASVLLDYCHSSCHTSCHSSRGRR